MTQPAPFFLDCDTGIDDALALAYLLASPGAELVGIGTVSGNVSAAGGAKNTLDLLKLAGHPDIPVAVGAHDPQVGTFHGGAPHVHGDNGIGGVDLAPSDHEPVEASAAELLVRLAHQYAGELRLVAIGPLTNIAQALRLEPALPQLIAEVTIMGGAALAPGNITAVAEANIANDPEAAAEVLAADWNVTLVPLDVTMTNVLEENHRQELLATEHPVSQALGEMLGYYFGFYVDIFGRACSAMHDPLAAAIAVRGVELTVAPTVRVQVDTTDGPGRGQTVCDLRGQYAGFPEQRGARCRVVLEIGEDFAPHLLGTLQAAWLTEEEAAAPVA
ncbi:nucleoside hydrolase [Paenarthrobacter nitroguajacolicus]|uniref:nucleoside hydrolase n=1 Tax=Paenarthrobacter nitroguajacolicus TaxID=211146 RepID=UPI00248CECEC|nr:nucleoside hydrolase [Paenarthrobacter nitroguajacolicus]MDI2037191.1 Pyrimidine-specific ribonucleoside hydrolase RihA [Paenarthrobacter nitroguajacolicus]